MKTVAQPGNSNLSGEGLMNQTEITDIDIPFHRLVCFFFKAFVAAIPAGVAATFVVTFVLYFVGSVV